MAQVRVLTVPKPDSERKTEDIVAEMTDKDMKGLILTTYRLALINDQRMEYIVNVVNGLNQAMQGMQSNPMLAKLMGLG